MASMVYVALNNVQDLDAVRDVIERFGPTLLRTVNDVGRWAHQEARKRVSQDINWPAGYLNEQRLSFKPARVHDRTRAGAAIIRGRARPSTMTRFAMTAPGAKRAGGGIEFQVKKGKHKALRKAFFRKLKGNMLVMMREGDYRQMPDINASKYVWNGFVFLYGPSIDQVFRTHRDGPEGIASEALDLLEEAFNALFKEVRR